jgi:hypothetical protein
MRRVKVRARVAELVAESAEQAGPQISGHAGVQCSNFLDGQRRPRRPARILVRSNRTCKDIIAQLPSLAKVGSLTSGNRPSSVGCRLDRP